LAAPKRQSAADTIRRLNPNVEVVLHNTRLTSQNASTFSALRHRRLTVPTISPTRYLTNDACVLLKKPNVYGSIFRFDGQASALRPIWAGRAIAVFTRNRRRLVRCRAARKAVCWACCPASSA